MPVDDREPDVEILDRGADYVVVNKPPDTLVVPARGSKKKTLTQLTAEAVGREVFAVHRLDRGTTGCCVFALTHFGEQALTQAFRKRIVDKRYVALTVAEVDFTKVSVDEKLLRPESGDDKNEKRIRQTVDDAGKSAITNFRRLAIGAPSLISAHPLTGRMHQIRAHLAHLGFPIVGDDLYGARDIPLGKHHLALHAYYISFPRPRGGRAFVIVQPPDLFIKRMPDGALKALARYRESLEEKREAHVKRAQKRSVKTEASPNGPQKGRTRPPGKKGPQKGPRGRPASKIARNKVRKKKGTRGGH